MADLISREYALAIIQNQMIMKEPEEGEPLILEAYKSGFRDAMEQIRLDLMTVPVREKWIPMTVKEPHLKGFDYIVCHEDYGLLEVSVDEWMGTQWMNYKNVKAWMPMPLPYIEPKKRRRTQK